jgi:hypothetical protein
MPQDLRSKVQDILEFLRLQKVIRHDDQEVEYLLSVRKNGLKGESVGRSICVFGLIPDGALVDHANIHRRLSQNLRASTELANIQRPLRERIGRLPVRSNTIQNELFGFLRLRHTDTPRTWASEIACDPRYRHLAFENWELDDGDEQTLRLILEPFDLPKQIPDKIGGAAQMAVLDLNGRQVLKVSLRSLPKPVEVPGWKTFRIQILSVGEQGEAVAWESNNYPKPAGRNQKFSRTIKAADLSTLDEGTYYLKVDAYDQNGSLLTQRRPLDPDKPDSRAENESDYFLVLSGVDETEVEAPEPRLIRVPSLLDAYVSVAGRVRQKTDAEGPVDRQSITGAWDQPLAASLRGLVHFELEGHPWQGYAVAVPAVFRRIELSILDHPEQLGLLRLDCVEARNSADLVVERREAASLPDWPETSRFIQARSAVFAAIQSQHDQRAPGGPNEPIRASIVETGDLLSAAEVILEYAGTFRALSDRSLGSESVRRSSPGALTTLSQMDLVELVWRRSAGDPGRAVLLSPTHPLRLLWHLQHASLCEEAVCEGREQQSVPSWVDFVRRLREGFLPSNLPLVIYDARGRGYIDQGVLTSHWSLFLPEGTNGDRVLDIPGCRDRVRTLIGLKSDQQPVSQTADREIASRAIDFIEQHPYVEQLRINVFNPGDGQVIVDALQALEREQATRRVAERTGLLRYAIQMFGGGAEHLETMGGALESLLDPERQVAEGDEFALTTTNHLLPKLVFACNTVDDFLKSPEAFPAHISLFLEHFNARTQLGRIDRFGRGSYVAGLLQEPEILLEADSARYRWSKGVRPAASRAPKGWEAELCGVHSSIQRLQAATASGQPQIPDVAPVVSLHLDASALALLRHSHGVSDWVITIDRHLGIEYFDSGRTSEEFGYLLDFSPATLQADRPRVMLSTRCDWELIGLVSPIFNRLGWPISQRQAEMVLETLRSLSGRLAFRLNSSPNTVDEVIGLLLGRWLMHKAGLLDDRVVIPLDAHQEWFRRRGEESAEGMGSRQRADLLLVGFAPTTSTVLLTVVEVKLRDSLSISERAYLYRHMREQSENTVRWIRERFDPELYPEPRADRLLCAKTLATTLAFYIRRGRRYRLIDDEVMRAALDFVENLDVGYHLDIRSLGVVFERSASGSHVDEEEPGYVVHRFGEDVARDLLGVTEERNLDVLVGQGGEIQRGGVSPRDSSRESAKEFESFRSAAGGRSSLSTKGRLESADQPEHEPPAQQSFPSSASVPIDLEPRGPEPVSPPSEQGIVQAQPSVAAVGGAEKEPESAGTVQAERVEKATSRPADAEASGQAKAPPRITPDILIGANELTAQFGILGRFSNASIAVDLIGCNTISLFGVQGFGKSYTLGVIAEMASREAAGINVLPAPLATVIFHYHKSDAYAPEYATAIDPNRKAREIDILWRDYGAKPQGLDDVVVLVPEAKVEQRQREFPGIEVRPIKFNSGELGAEGWKFLLGAFGNDSLYVRQLVAIMRRYRQGLTLDRFEEEIRDADLTGAGRRLAEDRINLARPYIDDSATLGSLLRPGRTVIVDLRDEWIEKEEALGLFVVMMRIFASSRSKGREFNKLVIFDEAHKYITESELIGQVVETIREMRHQATSVLIASQDPLSVPRAVIELTSILILHRMTSPQWLKHLKSAISALEAVNESHLSGLQPGEALLWAQRATDKRFSQRPQKVTIRPRFSQHGGGTKTAIDGETVR